MKHILITGENSYIGQSVKEYLLQKPEKYAVDTIDAKGLYPIPELFSAYDVVFNVAGIVHRKETKKNRHLYYQVNRDLAVHIAKAAKAGGVKQFLLLSTMSVYGNVEGLITKNTRTSPVNAYGRSKEQADEEIQKLEDKNFKFVCLRPPMVYGRNCKGNYQKLRRFALKSPIFPDYCNARSMIYIGNLCEFIKRAIDSEWNGLFFPQNKEYVSTARMVKRIAEANGKKIRFVKAFNGIIRVSDSGVVKKVFGDLTYEQVDLVDKYGFKESIFRTENAKRFDFEDRGW